ncbi:MAG: DUF4982 domain-containing protein [Kiritimatiellae bacterium]|nr:DUF4982 domain-containing protein [Kiritimatiellia bacterium]
MKKTWIAGLAGVAGMALAGNAVADAPRTRELFDDGWRFARFGAMPDGSVRPEPHQPRRAFTLQASSNEAGNVPAHAMDGDRATRWCASGPDANQWLAVDLGTVRPLGGMEITWEHDRPYAFAVDTSANGREWTPLGGQGRGNTPIRFAAGTKARFLRLRVTSLPQNSWASVREWRVLDASGAPYPNMEIAAGLSPAAPEFDDRGWRALNLPHDWGVEGPFRMDLENETGKLPWPGIGWYRKTFSLPASDAGRKVYLDFDGAMSQPQVYVNGTLAGEWKYGYTSFRVDISDQIRPGAKNIVAVRLDNPDRSSRWYPGGGIYRHVWMVRCAPVHIAHWGVLVTTPEIRDTDAVVRAEVTLVNTTRAPAIAPVRLEILDGATVVAGARIANPEPVAAGGTAVVRHDLRLPSPRRWDLNTPHLYTLRTTLENGDCVETRFGVREIEWHADRGFLLNGRKVILQGVCNHHDLGALGGAVHRRAIERQLELLREMGCNAIRTSHNPPAPELLELCDEMGFVVIDELFDAWKLSKKPNDYHRYWDNWHERDVRNFMLRDRNHPCVIAWSTGNEIPELSRTDHHAVPQRLYDLMRTYDLTRPITAGSNHPPASRNGFQKFVDVFGLNYHLGSYGTVQSDLPGKALYASETTSCVGTRGEYFFPVDWDKSRGFFNFQVSAYALYAPGWAYRPDLQFEALDRHPRYAGEFVWTGFDYLGEPTPYNLDSTNALNFSNEEDRKAAMADMAKLGNRAPSRSSYFGILDLAGFKKDAFYLFQARWRPELPMAHILPHWNWPERVGQVTPVHVFTSGDEAELFLNGVSLGRKQRGPFEYRLHWDDVVYAPGELRVVAYRKGAKWAENTVRTTGPAAQLQVTADRPALRADGQDLAFVTVQVSDAAGQLVPRSHPPLRFTIEGAGELVAVDNGDPTSHVPFQSREMKAFNGLCLAIIRTRAGEPGDIRLRVESPGLPPATVALRAE